MSKVEAAKFVFRCKNWYELALPIATHKIPSRVVLKNGIRFESHSIYWADINGIFFQGLYNPLFLPIEPDDVVVDIGANIGVFSIYAATKTRNTVYAFEPFPQYFDSLNQNICANNLDNITPYQCAVSNSVGTEFFSDSPLATTQSVPQMNRPKKVALSPSGHYIEVPSMTLEHFMGEHRLETIDFLKLDCEGSEGIILESTPKSCLQRIRKIAMEFHDGLSKLKHPRIQAIMEDAGFTTHLEWDGVSKLGTIHAWQS
jgi:FkbM family methyltransferase